MTDLDERTNERDELQMKKKWNCHSAFWIASRMTLPLSYLYTPFFLLIIISFFSCAYRQAGMLLDVEDGDAVDAYLEFCERALLGGEEAGEYYPIL